MTEFEKLYKIYMGSDKTRTVADCDEWNAAREQVCLSVANTTASEAFREIVNKENCGCTYWRDKRFKPIFEMVSTLVYNGLKEISFYIKDSGFTKNHISGMCYLIEGTVNTMLESADLYHFNGVHEVNGYMLGYLVMDRSYRRLFVDDYTETEDDE